MEFTLDYASLSKKLEIQELESPAGQTSPQVYGQLLAIYLLFNDLTSAKFLWKRIPDSVKKANDELFLIWSVGKLLWKKNYAQIYPTINSCPSWPNHLKNIMKLILDSTRQRVVQLILKAYSNISLRDASQLLGYTEQETLGLAQSLNWTYDSDSDYLNITQCDKNSAPQKGGSGQSILGMENSTELLEKLTDYIVFLESAK